MIIFIAIGVVVICCMVASANNRNEEIQHQALEQQQQALEQQQQALAMQAAAKRPEAFAKLFAEEFPEFASDITYAKAQACLRAYDQAVHSKEHRRSLNWTGKKYKDYRSQKKAEKYILQHVAAHVSPEFQEYVESNMKNSWLAMKRVIDSSATLASG